MGQKDRHAMTVQTWAGQRLSLSRAKTVIEPGKVWQRLAQNPLQKGSPS